MFPKKLTALVILALLVSCTTPGQVPGSGQPSGSPTPAVSSSPLPSASSQTPVGTSPPVQSPVPTPGASVSPTVTPTVNPSKIPDNAFATITSPFSTFHALTDVELGMINNSVIVKANNDFGLKLFKDLQKEKSKDNIFISPASIAIALQMAYNGANNQTRDEMATSLGIDKLPLDQLNILDKLLFGKLSNPAPDITLNIANSLWSDKSRVTFNPAFKSNLQSFYGAEASEQNFTDPKTVGLINDWVAQKTNQKITNIIEKIDSDILAFIINASYFKLIIRINVSTIYIIH